MLQKIPNVTLCQFNKIKYPSPKTLLITLFVLFYIITIRKIHTPRLMSRTGEQEHGSGSITTMVTDKVSSAAQGHVKMATDSFIRV